MTPGPPDNDQQDDESDGAAITGGFDDEPITASSGPPQGREDSLPDALLGPAQHLLAAFEQPSPIGLSLTSSPGFDDRSLLIYVWLNGGGGWGFGVDTRWSTDELLVALADGIQEHLPEEKQTWGQARPRCPNHRHPAMPRLLHGVAWWVCPAQGTRLSPIAPVDSDK